MTLQKRLFKNALISDNVPKSSGYDWKKKSQKMFLFHCGIFTGGI